MGEAASTAVLTVEDIGEKFPESKSDLRFLVPLQDFDIKIGDRHRFSVQGKIFLCTYFKHIVLRPSLLSDLQPLP